MVSTGQRPVMLCKAPHKEWKWEVGANTKSFPVVWQEKQDVLNKADRGATAGRQLGCDIDFFFLKKKITNLGFQLLMGDSCWCSGFTEISLREAQGWGGREEWRGATDRLRGSFAAEVKAELLGSWKWDRLKPRLLSCVYVLWVCLFSQGRPALHQHRSGLHEFFLLLKHGLN